MIQWRFDQGRLAYMQFDEIKKLAKAMEAVDGSSKPRNTDPDTLRAALSKYSSQPFAPASYTVWRNYKRVFGTLMLGAEVSKTFFATDICKMLASSTDELDSDDYFAHVARKFYYPSPVYEDYVASGPQIFPMVALIKYLISEYLVRGKNYATLEEVINVLVANQVNGTEPLVTYSKLSRRKISLSDDEIRQIRELLIFVSQISFLKWETPKLYLEATDKYELYEIEKSIAPDINLRKANSGEEILQLGGVAGPKVKSLGTLTLSAAGHAMDDEFVEGKKARVSHLRSERSGQLKLLYFKNITNPEICRMCAADTAKRYAWTDHVIELHHLLPLSSPVRVETGKTSIKDLVGLCPSCHRATHKYYSQWLKKMKRKDFAGYDEARAVYDEAKSKIVLP
jgi:hypothetical protein